MADLPEALNRMFAGGDVTVFTAVVDAIGTGVVTIHYNGGTTEDVPWLSAAFFPAISPSIGVQVYVLARKDWGAIVIGSAAPGPERDPEDEVVTTWDPFTMATFNPVTGLWAVSTTGDMTALPGDTGRVACFFLRLSDLPVPPADLATSSFLLDVPSFDSGIEAVDFDYLEFGLHANATPDGALVKVAGTASTIRVYAGESEYVSIPLDWAERLMAGTAKGIYFAKPDYPTVISGPGTVRLTSL